MLVLSRKVGEKVIIGDSITVTVVEVDGRRVKLAFSAPDDVHILRAELAEWRDPPTPAPRKPERESEPRPNLIVNR